MADEAFDLHGGVRRLRAVPRAVEGSADRAAVATAVRRQRAQLLKPPMSVDEFLQTLQRPGAGADLQGARSASRCSLNRRRPRRSALTHSMAFAWTPEMSGCTADRSHAATSSTPVWPDTPPRTGASGTSSPSPASASTTAGALCATPATMCGGPISCARCGVICARRCFSGRDGAVSRSPRARA